MANLTAKTIAELPAAASMSGSALFAISQGGASQKLSWEDLLVFMQPGVIDTFNFTVTGEVSSYSGLPSGLSYTNGVLRYAFTSDYRVGKIYGGVRFRNTTSSQINQNVFTGIQLAVGSRPETAYTIQTTGICLATDSSNGTLAAGDQIFGSGSDLYIDTDGKIYLKVQAKPNKYTMAYYPASLYFFYDFGD